MTSTRIFPVVNADDVAVNRRRGGEIRTLLSPATTEATTGFMGTGRVLPGDRITEHYHPYSEEFLYVTQGSLVVDLDGVEHHVQENQGLMIPREVRHRVRNISDTEAAFVFHLCPLAPRPDLGHVDTEEDS
ncbi:cupin domain-containing protein [Nocardiopsis alba]|uniref:Cupin domain-containing protein n=1 Tax=Nocardiopsis alba TaxID=53437 RepID=A0A7K2INW1_9ACTN|nr:cupin domain-containing protein [Nocardiopsis alba]MYR31671.1 cupin domain-containing protein [Nocardiopsis alba]